ncbi:MAG: hypothetical protein KU28_01240 [Sulfurovum sp. PC08-66]|nr:MAG: hypothetical protein KU28_01240 [Sulfurovum sp. PC08-66]KIM12581.1 MAG: hypothetical protein KU37_01355 [Sulfuricurvum sp. PC08-66]
MHSRLETNFAANMTAIQAVRPKLHQKIVAASVAHSYELRVVDAQSGLYNIHDTLQQMPVFKDIFEELKTTIKEVTHFGEEPYIYLYGISNGFILNFLLQNSMHHRICLFEPELEMLFTAMHLYDFALAITTHRLVLIDAKRFAPEEAKIVLSTDERVWQTQRLILLPNGIYYKEHYKEHYKELWLKTAQTLANILKNVS